jgi:hypothetical protein
LQRLKNFNAEICIQLTILQSSIQKEEAARRAQKEAEEAAKESTLAEKLPQDVQAEVVSMDDVL